MEILGQAQGWVMLALGVGALLLCAYALVDALRRPARLFPAADKRTKGLWVGILGLATALVFVNFTGNSLGFLSILSVVAAGVYLADVKPALDASSGRGRGDRRNMGPYGPW